MRLATFVPPRAERSLAGEVRGEHVVDFGPGATVRALLAQEAIEPAAGRAWPLAEVRLLAPVPDPIAIYGIGLNYAAHAAETGAEPPEAPIVFAKMPGSVGAARRAGASALRWCGGSTTRASCAPSSAPGAESAATRWPTTSQRRDLQGREPQWIRAKGADTFCPFGPWITTIDAVPDPQNLRLRTWVNGEVRQDSSTSDLIFGPQQCADFIAETCTLHPGDLILTGTPGGVGMASGALPRGRRRRADRDRGPGRDRAHDRNALVAGSVSSHFAMPVRIALLRPLARERAPGVAVGVYALVAATGAGAQCLSITRSIRPYSTASSALKKRSRSMSSWTLVERLARVAGVELVDAPADIEDLARVDLDIRRLALEPGRGLVDEHARVGEREALAMGATRQQQRPHRHRHPEADRLHVGLDELHRVVDRQPGVDRPPGELM